MPDLSTPVPTGNTALIADEPSDLAVAANVAHRMLAAYGTVDHGDTEAVAYAHRAVTESLRILVRALDRNARQHQYAAAQAGEGQ